MISEAKTSIGRAGSAAAAYAAGVFAIGIVLGTLRLSVVAPAVGEFVATAIELPLMLGASWLMCGSVMRRFAVPIDIQARVTTGAVAFALLMAAEASISMPLLDRSFIEHVATYRDGAKQLGLVGKCIFALMPVLRRQAMPSASSA